MHPAEQLWSATAAVSTSGPIVFWQKSAQRLWTDLLWNATGSAALRIGCGFAPLLDMVALAAPDDSEGDADDGHCGLPSKFSFADRRR